MFKSIIAAIVLATASIATTANANAIQECVTVGQSIEQLATVRDEGVSPEFVYNYLTNDGIPEEMVILLLTIVYIEGANIDGKTLNKVFVQTCIGELA